MRIDRLDLRLCRLPLVSFFETSFGRSLRSHVPARPPRPARATRAGARRSPRPTPTTAARPPRRPGTSSPASSRRACSAPTFEHPREIFDRAAAGSRPQHGQGRRRDGGVGSVRAGAAASRSAACSAARAPHRVGRVDRHPGFARRAARRKSSASSPPATSGSRSRSSPAGTSTRSRWCARAFGEVPLMVDANAAYSLADAAHLARLDAYELMMIEQPLDYDDVSDHVDAAGGAGDADLPGRVDSHGAHRPRRHRRRRLPHHQHQARPGRRAPRIDPAARSVRRARHPGVARRHARNRHRPRAQHSPRQPAELFAARRHRGQQALLRARPDRSADRGGAPTARSPCPTAPASACTIVAERVERATERMVSLDRSMSPPHDAHSPIRLAAGSWRWPCSRPAPRRPVAPPSPLAPLHVRGEDGVDPAARGGSRAALPAPPPAPAAGSAPAGRRARADRGRRRRRRTRTWSRCSATRKRAFAAVRRWRSGASAGRRRSRRCGRVLASDADPEVRQMAAFALGLIGDAAAADALTAALADPDPLVQGRAAEALGLIGAQAGRRRDRRDDARRTCTPARSPASPPTTWSIRSRPPVEAVRLGIYALVRLKAYDSSRRCSSTAPGSRSAAGGRWPMRSSRVGDPRAGRCCSRCCRAHGVDDARVCGARARQRSRRRARVAPLVAIVGNSGEVAQRPDRGRARAGRSARRRRGGRPLTTFIAASTGSEPAPRSGHRARTAAPRPAPPTCSSIW